MPELNALYLSLKQIASSDLNSSLVTESITELTKQSLSTLSGYTKVVLNSSIPKKEYFVFENNNYFSRPVNTNLFLDIIDDSVFQSYIKLDWTNILQDDLQKVLYTIGIAYCAAIDVLGKGDKKTPSVFFEIYIANLFAREYNVNPSTQIQIEIDELHTSLPTDYIFQPPNQFIKIHLPVKLSTRERSVQAWAHQRVLEGIHGVGRYRGVMVVLAETNFVRKSQSVVEVCLPEQWRVYQMFISQMTRIYYLDLPEKYEELPGKFPHIQVKPFAEFFKEKDLLVVRQ